MSRRPERVLERARATAAAGLVVLSVGLAVAAAALVSVSGAGQPPAHWYVAVALAVAFAVAEATQLHVEFRRETFSVSLSELPLVLGLFVLPAGDLVMARLAGAVVVFAWRRTPAHKATFNLALFAAETAIAAALFSRLVPDAGLAPRDWLLTYACVAAAETASAASVVAGMAVLGSKPSWDGVRRISTSLLVAGTLNTTLALVVLIMLDFSPATGWLLVVIAAITVAAYGAHARLLTKHTSLGQLYDLSKQLTAAPSYDDLVALLVDRCREVLRAERVVVRTLAECGDDDMLAQVAGTGRTRVLPRRSRDPAVRAWLARHGLRDAVLASIRDGTAVVGLLQVENRLGEMSTFTADDVRMLDTVTSHAEAALRGSRLLAQLRHDANHDALTGLGNRTLLFAGIEDLLRREVRSAVLLLDLDRFKEVNDSLGHRIGDLLLGEVAQRLRQLVPAEATVARLGGDEFAVLLPACPSAEAAERLAVGIRAQLSVPFDVANTTLEVGASIGVALLPDQGADAVSLLQHADVAMYAAKARTAGVAVYSSDDDEANLRRLALSRELRRGIESGELVVHYQPKVALLTGELIGVEALVRWEHPVRGRVMPDEFISVAEQCGLIGLLTEEVLGAALLQVRGWLDVGYRIGVAVNLSARGLHEPGLAAAVATQLAVAGVPAQLLTFEITESSLVADFDRAVEVLDELVALGISLSLDDFGTGYSSLAYLQRLPVQEVKIDKSFVMAMSAGGTGHAIVGAVIDLAHTLGMQVVAEGVEDHATRLELLSLGCDAMQGYLLSRPMPSEQATTWLTQVTRRIPEQKPPSGAAGRLRVVS